MHCIVPLNGLPGISIEHPGIDRIEAPGKQLVSYVGKGDVSHGYRQKIGSLSQKASGLSQPG